MCQVQLKAYQSKAREMYQCQNSSDLPFEEENAENQYITDSCQFEKLFAAFSTILLLFL